MSDAAQQADAADPEVAPETEPVLSRNGRNRMFVIVGCVVLTVALLWFLYATFIGSRTVSTDNAYVQADVTQVTALTGGTVAFVDVVDTQQVKRGQILFRLDARDQKIALAQAEAGLQYAQRMFRQDSARARALGATTSAQTSAIGTAQARLQATQAALVKAQADYARRAGLQGTGAVSAEDISAAREALEAAQADRAAAQAALRQAQSQAANAREQETAGKALTAGTTVDNAPSVLLAKSNVAKARLDYERTVVRSPVDGVVVQRAIEVGQDVAKGAMALRVVPVDQLYVNANFKENQLGKVRVGQKATLSSDYYGGDVVYHGRVVGLAGGTGAAFSLIPAQNATGNWIKVVQRLPVRIALDPKELREHPLRVGLSMDAEIDVADND